ncbi:hypothetical protein [Nocardia sp. NPDC049707]
MFVGAERDVREIRMPRWGHVVAQIEGPVPFLMVGAVRWSCRSAGP